MEFGKYKTISTRAGEDDANLETLILDTNVAIDIERFYYGDASPSADLESLLLAFPRRGGFERSVDINYGWAVAEATWDPVNERANLVRYRRMTHALSTVVNWSAEEIERAFAARTPPVNRDRTWPRKVAMPRPEDVPAPTPMVAVNYSVLLKTLHIASSRKGLRGKSAERAFAEVVDWARDTLGIFDTYGIQVAMDLLCGDAERKGAAQRLLKYSGPAEAQLLRQQAWNSAWDLLFTRLCDGYSYGLLPGAQVSVTNVVTRNVDLPYLRSIVETAAVFKLGAPYDLAPLTVMTSSLAPHVDPDAIRASISGGLDSASALARFARDPDDLAAQADTALAALERDLDAQGTTSF